MTTAVVTCPACRRPARVPASALGLIVACPRCGHQFAAEAVAEPIPAPPTVFPKNPVAPPPPAVPVVFRHPRYDREAADPHADGHHRPPGNPLLAMALVPLGIPLLWLVLTLAAPASAFSFAAPVGIAAGIAGTALGLASVRRWSPTVRVWSLFLLLGLGYGVALACYFAPADWLELHRELAVLNGGLGWKEFAPAERTFKVKVPTGASEPAECLPEWNLTATAYVHRRKPVDRFVVAYGPPPADLRRLSDDAWFAAARDKLVAACGGTLSREIALPMKEGRGREFFLELPDAGTRKVVQVLRLPAVVVVLSVEGPFLVPDRADLQHFFNSFRPTIGK